MINRDKIIKEYKLCELEEILFACEEEFERVINTKKIKDQADNYSFLLFTSGKSILSTREIISLCKDGFPDGALSIARNIFEQLMIVAYIESKSDNAPLQKAILQKYDDDYIVQRARALKYEADYITKDSQKADEYINELDTIKAKYSLAKVPKDYWWLEDNIHNFRELCDYVIKTNDASIETHLRMMNFLYKRACLSIHASNLGNRLRLGSKFAGIDMGPWETGQENALYFATSSLIVIIGFAFSVLSIHNENILSELNNLAIYYLNILRKAPQ